MAQTKAQLQAAAQAKQAAATAAAQQAIKSKMSVLENLKGRVQYKTGATDVKPVSYDEAQKQLDAANALTATALDLQRAAQAAQSEVTNFKAPEIDKDTQDAYALLEEAFKLYGLESLVPVIRGYMEQDLGPEQAKLKLKSEQAYKDRFKGNELRVGKGLNAISEAAYIELENDYSDTLRAYGLGDYFGTATDATTRLARQQKMAEVIGNDISAVEFKDRIDTVVTRVNMSDANVKTELKRLYDITDTDLVKYFLNPKEGSEQLKQKVTVAEIGGASLTQGLGQTSLGTAEELAKLGIDRAEALAGYSKIAQYLPTTEKLSSIYASEGITYNKATGEEEEFKGLASAKRKRQTLAAREIGAFSGSSGISQVSLKGKTTGQI